MKIAFVTSKYPRLGGTFVQREINGYRASGIDVDIYPIYPKNEKVFNNPKILSTLEGKNPFWEKTHYMGGGSFSFLIGAIKMLFPNSLSKKISQAFSEYFKQNGKSLIKFLYCTPKAFSWSPLDSSYEHVLSFWGNYAGTTGYFMARRSNIPFSIFLHAGTDLYRDRAFLLEKLMYAHKIITVCEFNRRFLEKAYPEEFHLFAEKIVIHHLGLDLSRYQFQNVDERSNVFRICCIGALRETKGSFLVLKSFHHFIQAGGSGELVYCGIGPLFSDLKKYCEENNILDKVIFKGMCSNEEVNATLNASHLLVHGSPFIGDAVPTVIKEAMAMARPVLATNVAGIPELVEDNVSGILVDPQNIDQLSSSMLMFSKDLALCQRMGEKGREIAEKKFDLWKNTSTLIKKLKID